MSLKGKDTFSKWGSSRLKSSFGKVANSRFWPVTKILRRFPNVRLLAAVGSENGPPRSDPPSSWFGFIITKKFLRSCRKPLRRFLSDNDKGILLSAGRQTDRPTDHRCRTKRACNRPTMVPFPAPRERLVFDLGNGQ